ncbi:hypothetical protein U4E84_09615 [Halorubrum sp. AD140]|uniref:hypothetical protein n=1 Tax=Halorubrum sp. AD140 TaxID=3050073 RepID=UPI002ACCC03F|nr:hypothetical protein [Halorubrum sp. AD140]MDZ5811600.1 hypothetical protein [Halorubrum sp. AD140]
MSFRDGAIAGGAGGTFAVGADLLINGGEVAFALFGVLLDQSGLVYLLLSRLLSAAPHVAWLPAAEIELAFTAISLFLAAFTLYRLAKRSKRELSERL